jgi:hypothetical protein
LARFEPGVQIRKEFVLGQLLAGELERIEGHPRAPL